ncbi:hypothetical protein AVEN_210389-1, partial [Araneus ventricosus]
MDWSLCDPINWPPRSPGLFLNLSLSVGTSERHLLRE